MFSPLLRPLVLLSLLSCGPTAAAQSAGSTAAQSARSTATRLARGTLALDTVHGYSLENTPSGESPDRRVAVYLPPSYAAAPERRFPVLYLLHGIGGTDRDWVGAQPAGASRSAAQPWLTVQDVMDRGIAAGVLAEMIVVAPDQMTRGGGSFYTNSVLTGGWEDFTVVDLVAHVDATYRTLAAGESRGIAGHSMGGYGALKLGMKHPQVFQVVYAMNAAVLGFAGDLTQESRAYAVAAEATPGSLNPGVDFWPPSLLCIAQALSPNLERPPFYADLPFVPSAEHGGALRPVEPVVAAWRASMPLYMVAEHADNLRSLRALRFDSGVYDEFTHIVLTNRSLSTRLNELAIPHVFEEYNGDHRNRLWGPEGRVYTEVLPFFSRLLAAE